MMHGKQILEKVQYLPWEGCALVTLSITNDIRVFGTTLISFSQLIKQSSSHSQRENMNPTHLQHKKNNVQVTISGLAIMTRKSRELQNDLADNDPLSQSSHP